MSGVSAISPRRAPTRQHRPNSAFPARRFIRKVLLRSRMAEFIIGSIGARTIYVVKPGAATAKPWTQPDNELTLGIIGVFADEKANTLWACFSSTHDVQQPPSTLKTSDLQTGSLKERYPLPTAGAFCNDIAVGADGTAYISDTNNMEVDRLAPGSHQLQVWAGSGDSGPKGGVLDGISVLGNRLFVNTLETNKLFMVPIEA